MSGPHLSGATKALLSAAKSDAPSAAMRAKVWGGVSGTVGAVGGVAGAAAMGAAGGSAGAGASIIPAAGAAATAGLSAAKMLTAGTLFGAALTVGLAAMLLRVGPAPADLPPPGLPSFVAAGHVSPGIPADTVAAEELGAPSPLPGVNVGAQTVAGRGPLEASPGPVAPGHPSTRLPGQAGASPLRVRTGGTAPPRPSATQRAGTGIKPVGPADALAREAGLISEARAALARGDAHAALALAREARALPGSMLGPEELAVEVRALRALGDADQANGVDATLRSQFPDSALAR